MKRSMECVLVDQCAPTLAGLRAGSLFRYIHGTPGEVRSLAWEWDRRLRPHGMALRPLRDCPEGRGCLLFLWRGERVRRILSQRENRAFLRSRGYRDLTEEAVLEELSRRLCAGGEYPHEVGLLLGYPLEDVTGFIRCGGKDFTCCGAWKVYGDPDRAQAYFDRCHTCTREWRKRYLDGSSVLELIASA